MKNYIKISLLSLTVLGLASCDLDAPTQSTLDESTMFSTYALAEAEVMSINVSFGETNSYRGRYLPYYGLNNDVEIGNSPDVSKAGDDNKNDLWNYATKSTNSQMNTENNAYAMFYQGIERANLAIQGLRQYGNTASNAAMAQLLGEALTLRAVLYLDLVKAWGDVPARFEPVNSQTIYLPRTDRDSIYLQLLNDLEEAETLVAWPNESNVTKTTERVSKAFVKALRARIALYAGGYSYRQDKTVRLSNILNRTEMYNIARQECVDIINSGYNKLGEFKDNFTALCKEDVTAGRESIYEIPFAEGRGRVLYTFGVLHQHADQYTQQNKGGVNGPTPFLFYDYDVDDVRRDVTCVPYRWSNADYAVQELASLDRWCFGKLRYEWMNRIVTSTNDDGINFQYMRLGDVYLMAAEAINELDGPANAAQYLRPILERALPADKVSALMAQYTASKEAFFNGIVEQRKLELAGEMLRKADLVRWNLIDQKMAEAKTKLNDLRNREGDYADLPTKLYTKLNGENLIIYGLNHGDTDDYGKTLTDYEATTWISETKIQDNYIDGLYINTPSTHAIWPIWQTFVDGSNGRLSNDWLGF